MRLRSSLRPAAIATAAMLMSTAAVMVTTSSEAAVVGSLTIAPHSGLSSTPIDVTTSAGCPPGGTNVVARVSGSGFPVGGYQAVGNTDAGVSQSAPFTVSMSDTFQTFAAAQQPPATLAGKYDITVICRDALDPASLGEFVGSIWFTSPTSYQDTNPAPTSTSTTLSVTPAAPQPQGTAITLAATVAPSVAAGTVQFKDGATNLGSPAAVSAGTASLVTSALVAGPHSLTATFTPTSATAYAGSTSGATSYTISLPAPAWKPILSGTVRVGYSASCLAAFDYATTVTYSWLRNGVAISGATGATYLIPETAYAQKLSCSVHAANATGTTSSASAQATIGVGPALRATRAPVRTGTARVGYTNYCSSGTWTPAATSYTYQWKRNGASIRGATRSSYRLTTSDRARSISCTVTARRTNWTPGVKTTAAVNVR